MNILQIAPELNAGGVERTTLEIAAALIDEGHGAHIGSSGGRMEQKLITIGGQLHRYNASSKNILHLLGHIKYLSAIIQRNNIDIVHARSRAPAWAAYYATQKMQIGFITTYHGVYNGQSKLKRFYNSIMARGDFVIANSHYTANHISQTHGVPDERIRIIPRGVDLSHFTETVPQGRIDKIRAHWRAFGLLPLDHTILLLPGRLTRWKGQLDAIQAMQGISGVTLVLQGDEQGRTQYMQELQRAIAHYAPEAVIIAPHHIDMPAAYSAADMVLSASTDPEAFGRVTAEACAMGRYTIATAHGGSVEILRNGQLGTLIRPGDPHVMRSAIQMGRDLGPKGRAVKSQEAKHIIRKQYPITEMCRKTLSVYKDRLKVKL